MRRGEEVFVEIISSDHPGTAMLCRFDACMGAGSAANPTASAATASCHAIYS